MVSPLMSYATMYGCDQFVLTPLTIVRIVSRLFLLLLMFMFKFAMLCHVDNFDSTKLVVLD